MSGLLTLEVEMIKNHFSDDTIFGVKKKKKKMQGSIFPHSTQNAFKMQQGY